MKPSKLSLGPGAAALGLSEDWATTESISSRAQPWKLAHSTEKHSKEQSNSSRGSQRGWQEQGQDLCYEASLCKQCYPTVTSISASAPGSALQEFEMNKGRPKATSALGSYLD